MKKIILSLAIVGFGSFVMAQTTMKPELTPEKKAEWQAKRDGMKKRGEEMQKQHLQEMKQNLGLSDDQVSKIQALQDKRKEEFKQNRSQDMQDMKAKRDEHDNEMKQILTPDQYKKWQEMKAKKMDERKEMHKGDGMRKGDFKKMDTQPTQ